MNATSLHVPGHWECPLCGFQQIKSILAPGGVYTDTAPHLEPCPNDGRDMVPLTWQRACENQEKVLTQLLDQITAKDEAIADLNQRLIDRTSGMLDAIRDQQLEIARGTAAHREVCRQVLSLINGNIRLFSERDAAHAQIVSLRSALQHIERSSGSSETVHCCQAALSAPPPPMVPKQAPDIGSDSIVASCNCLTKTPEVKYHKPGCKYRLISERDAAREIIEQAYVHNQNMHCFTTKGRLNDQINEQTTLLRKFLKP